MKKFLSGNEAVAQGAWEAGCKIACAYPGTPSTEILENIAKYKDIYCEWSTNEKVAFEVASGACFGGARVLVAMKHVGLNVAADPLFSMSYSGVSGGFVIVSADEPECHSSQNEQDNRHYARAAKIPMLEPSDSQETKELIKIAFDISEKFDTPVLFRMTTRICHSKGIVETGERIEYLPKGYKKDIKKRLVLPAHARLRHRLIEEKRLPELKKYNETFSYNYIEADEHRSPTIGIITSGISYQYAKEVFPDASFLKLSMTYPLSENLIKKFSQTNKKLYVIEELDPFLENEIKAMGIDVIGKDKVPICGELNTHILRESFGPALMHKCGTDNDLPPRPPVLCPGCPHRGVFYAINKLKLIATGDIGCYTLGALPPLNAMDTCICMGASIGNAFGLEKALGDDIRDKLVAVIGDSTFLHSGITSLIDIVYNKGTTTVIIVDNGITAMTGHQEHPGTGKTLMGEETVVIKPEDIGSACGIKHISIIDPYNIKETKEVIKREVARKAPSLIIARRECALRVKPNPPLKVDPEICTGCKLCLGLGCPAIAMKDEKAIIDSLFCNGCGMCKQVCVKGAITKEVGSRKLEVGSSFTSPLLHFSTSSLLHILDKIGEIAEKKKIKAYLVGGPVRDFIMQNEIKDIDICVEGNGISFAKTLKKYFNCVLKTYPQFNTATLFLDDFSIDIATCRKETYPYPVSLPIVENGNIFTDLTRRDFTINSIAMSLDKKREFIDPFSGKDDIKKGLVKVLHKKSFLDDPTRIFRAIRFQQRFDFRLEKETKDLLNQGIRMINKLSPERIRNEIMLLLREQKKEEIFNQLHKLGILDIIKLKPPQLGVSISLFALIDPDKMPDFLTKNERQIAQGIAKISLKEDLLKKAEKPSQIYQILFGIPEESLVFIMTQKPVIKDKIKEFLNLYTNVKPEITGRDLGKLGIQKGPIYKEILTKTLLAKLDGKIKGKEEEINFAKGLVPPN